MSKPVRNPNLLRGCESCIARGSDFETDTTDPKVIRCYCKKRFVKVDAEIMSKDCDFFEMNEAYRPEKKEDRYGI